MSNVFIDTGTLRMFTGLATGTLEIWNRTGSAGNYWRRGEVNITTNANFEIIFEVIVGAFGLLLLSAVSVCCSIAEKCAMIYLTRSGV